LNIYNVKIYEYILYEIENKKKKYYF